MTETATEFSRSGPHFTDRITARAAAKAANGATDADGTTSADGPDEHGEWPVQPGRYRLVASRACPWASRSIIVRRLLGLEEAISLAIVDPIQDERSWRFTLDPDGTDPVLGIRFLHQAYDARELDYPGGVSVPAVVDVPSGRLVTNDYHRITLDLQTEWTGYHRPGAPDLYPEPLREQIDELNQQIFTDVNNGVYRAGFAHSQQRYEEAYRRLFDRLDGLSELLADRRYLLGDQITEADVRLFVTLVRFDAVYHGHFKCNRQKLAELPVLWAYSRDLFQTPGFGDTVDFDHIKRHYHCVQQEINPSRIVPLGPDLSGWLSPHGRERLGGSPFGAGTPPAPVRPEWAGQLAAGDTAQ
jgi:putative glutathione S-transferase